MNLKNRIKRSISASKNEVFLRKEFDRFGSYRQVSRVLNDLATEGRIVRSGYGVYSKPTLTAVDRFLDQVHAKLTGRTRRTVEFGSRMIQLGSTPKSSANAQTRLDEYKLRLALELVERFDLDTIRKKSLENLARWKKNDAWCSAYDEWRQLLRSGSDQHLRRVMTGEDQTSNRLRQSPPYTGLLDPSTLEKIREEETA